MHIKPQRMTLGNSIPVLTVSLTWHISLHLIVPSSWPSLSFFFSLKDAWLNFFKPTAITSCQPFFHSSEVSIIVITRKLIFQSSENSLLKHNEMLTFNYTCRNIRHVHLGNFRKAVTGLRLNIIDTAHYTIFPPIHSAVFFPLK